MTDLLVDAPRAGDGTTTPATTTAYRLRVLAGEMWRLCMEDPNQVLLVRNDLSRAVFDLEACIQAADSAHAEQIERGAA